MQTKRNNAFKIAQSKMPQYRHIKFLILLEKKAKTVYSTLSRRMIADIIDNIPSESLAKSEAIPPGWTQKLPRIELDIGSIIDKALEPYIRSMLWLMLGDYAGKDARAAAKKIGLVGKVVPGLVQSAYLHSLDSHRLYYSQLFGGDPATLPNKLVKESLSQIAERQANFLEQLMIQLRNNMSSALNFVVEDHNQRMTSKAHNILHTSSEDDVMEDAIDRSSTSLSGRAVEKALQSAAKDFSPKWEMAVQSGLAQSSAVATHQAMYEVFGADDKDLKVAWMTMEDEKTCAFCNKASRRPDGTYKLYKLSDFKPAGYNFNKKKDQWLLSIAPAHHRCRCYLVYVPKGFALDKSGALVLS